MTTPIFQVKVPGSVMLFGEHAVLHGKQALVCAIDRHVTITLTPRTDQVVKLTSSAFDEHLTTVAQLQIVKPYDYALAAIMQQRAQLTSGFELHITANFPPTIGFGSSAAVIVATLGVLDLWLTNRQPFQLTQLHQQALAVIHSLAGVGSGADAAASVFGGVVAYRNQPITIEPLVADFSLVAAYCGFKTPTPQVIAIVAAKQAQLPNLFAQIYELMHECATAAISAIKQQDWVKLGAIMNVHHGLQDALGVNNLALSELIFQLRELSTITGAKISGSGLGDCVIGLGSVPETLHHPSVMPLQISQQGLVVIN